MKNKFDPQIMEARAEKFRQSHSLGLTRSLDFDSLLRDLKVQVVFKPLGESFSGMALKHGGQRFMLINTDQSLGRQNFTIAHELYHLFVQEDFSSQVCQVGRFGGQVDPEERNADWFAAHLLMPHYRILAEIPDEEMEPTPDISLRTIVRLEQDFKCSRMALLVRLESMRLITARQKEEYAQHPADSARRFGYSTELYQPARQRASIGDYADLAARLYDHELVSETHYANLLLDYGINLDTPDTEFQYQ